jgi:hypothetical protein
MAATAIYDPSFIEQYGATRYGGPSKGVLNDRSTRAYWDAAQQAKAENANLRRQEEEAQKAQEWQGGENLLDREAAAALSKQTNEFNAQQAADNRASAESVADKAQRGGLIQAGTQTATMLGGYDLMFNKGAGMKGLYNSATNGPSASQVIPAEYNKVMNYDYTKAPGEIKGAAQDLTDKAVTGIQNIGVPAPTATAAQQITENQGVLTQSLTGETIPTGVVEQQAANLQGTGTGVLPDLSAGNAPASAYGIETPQVGTPGFTESMTAAPEASAFSLGTTVSGIGMVELADKMKPMVEDTFGAQGTWAGDLGGAGLSAVRGAGVAALTAGLGATAAIEGALAATGVGLPVAAVMIAADVISDLPKTQAWHEATAFIDSIPLLGPIGNALIVQPVEFILNAVNDAFNVVTDIISAPFKAAGSWICTEVNERVRTFTSEESTSLKSLLEYGMAEHRVPTEFYFKGNGNLQSPVIAAISSKDGEETNRTYEFINRILIDPVLEMIQNGHMEEAWQKYADVTLGLFYVYVPEQYEELKGLIEKENRNE